MFISCNLSECKEVNRHNSYGVDSQKSYAPKIIYSVSLMILGALAALPNGMFVVLFIRFRKRLLKKSNNKLMLSLVTADLFVGAMGMLTGIAFVTNQPKAIYKLLGTLPLFCFMYASILSLGAMTLDRLVAIKFPLRYKSLITSKRVYKLIAFSWTLPIMLIPVDTIISFMIGWAFELKFRNVLLTVFVVFGFLILLVCNKSLYSSIGKQRRRLRSLSVRYERSRAETNVSILSDVQLVQVNAKKVRKASTDLCLCSMCVWVVNVFIICWLPLTVYRLSYFTGRPGIPWLRRLSTCLAICNSILNPCIYIIKRSDFRQHIKDLFEKSRSYSAH